MSVNQRIILSSLLALALISCGEVKLTGAGAGLPEGADGVGIDSIAQGDGAGSGTDTFVDPDAGDATDAVMGDECETDFDCAPMTGKTPCKMPHCQSGLCVLQPQAPGAPCKSMSTPDTDCSLNRCDESAECVATPVQDGTLCGLGVCGKKCMAGDCVLATAQDYEDGNPCTQDWCDQGVKVVHDPITDLEFHCDDGDLCSFGDSCVGGKCQGKAANCDDLLDCTADACDPKAGCTHAPDSSLCSDGNPCTADGCDLSLGCTASAAGDGACDDGNTCTSDDKCASGVCGGTPTCGCSTDADCAAASTNLCLGVMTCQAGLCVADPVLAVVCTGSSTCAPVACDPKTGACAASPAADGAPCNDGNACTVSSSCKGGACEGSGAANCDDANPCTADACDPVLGCQNLASAGPCDDKNPCTAGDVCSSGACSGQKVQCDDDIACTVDSCADGKCGHSADAALCDDANPCTGAKCDPATGCQFPADDSAKCDDGDACTADTCKGGQCASVSTCACKADSDCNDSNACTNDKCQAGSCVSSAAADGVACDSGDKCQTPGSGKCQAGLCASGNAPVDCSGKSGACTTGVCDAQTGACAAVPKADGSNCDADGNGCTVADSCAAGACKAGKALDCSSSSDACNAGICKSISAQEGKCQKTPKPAGTSCDDGSWCTAGDACDALGACKSGAPVDCTKLDGPCAAGACDEAAKQCVSKPKPSNVSCSDGLTCTVGDHCDGAGGCAAGASLQCTGTVCAPAKCDEPTKGCKTTPALKGVACDDSNPCLTGDSCDGAGKCVGGAPKVCQGDACNTAACSASTGQCVLTPVADSTGCSDGDPCTTADTCKAGKCSAGAPVKCAGDACNTGSCDPANGTCATTPKANGTACDDAQPCTSGDACKSGVCSAGTWTCSCKPASGATDCNDGKSCTDDSCILVGTSYQCQNKAVVGKVCDDGNLCTTADICDASGLCTGTAIKCDDGNACTLDSCSQTTGKCVNAANTGATCTDGTACTTGDACTSTGTCVGKAVICDDANVCTANNCTASTGACAFPAVSGSCSDGNACTLSDACASGVCQSGKPVSCDDGNPCTSDSCDKVSGACAYTPNTLSCSDGNACTVSDVCSNGTCQPGPSVTCLDKNPCTDDVCDTTTGLCTYPANSDACSDGNACTLNDACKGGTCYGGSTVLCNDGNPCTNDSCVTSTGKCQYIANTLACNDGNACTAGDACSLGVCKGLTVNCDDNKICTQDGCSAKIGCTHSNLDGIVCGVKYLCVKLPPLYCTPTCSAGVCTKGTPL